MPLGCELKLLAPAKINLFLKVTGRRQDGYHLLSTWMQKLTLADEITLLPSSAGIEFCCEGDNLPNDEHNLAYKAAIRFYEKTRIKSGVKIKLVKKIPIAAGLGGGSSDAAVVLTGLNRLFSAALSESELMELGLSLGADVPFFVSGLSAAIATGIGEKLTQTDPLKNCRIVLVNPGFPVPTKWVYETFDSMQPVNLALTSGNNPYILGPKIDRVAFVKMLFNDLERVTISRYPEISEIKNELFNAGADGVLMSGSGPTVFGIFFDFDKGKQAVTNLQKKYIDGVFYTEPALI